MIVSPTEHNYHAIPNTEPMNVDDDLSHDQNDISNGE